VVSYVLPFDKVFKKSDLKRSDEITSSIFRITGTKNVDTIFGYGSSQYTCTGFQVDKQKVLTAAHCTGDNMLADGHEATLLKIDHYYDLALLSVEKADKPYLTLDDTPVKRFDELFASGYAYGWNKPLTFPVRAFIIDFPPVDGLPPGLNVMGPYIGGMSGGPLLNKKNGVVGVIQRASQNTGYSVGTVIIRAFMVGDYKEGHGQIPTTEYPTLMAPVPFFSYD
jgi:S1-C subfamily serine protease